MTAGGGGDGATAVVFADAASTAAFSSDVTGGAGVIGSGLTLVNAGAASGVMSAATLAMSSGFDEGLTPFITAPAKHQTILGFWGRTKGGSYDIDAGTEVYGNGGALERDSEFRTGFWGYQFGADLDRLNVGGSGFDLHVGVTAGDVTMNIDDRRSSVGADVKALFVGVHGAVSGNGFFADLQAQKIFYKIKLDAPVIGLRNEKVGGDGYAVIFSAGKLIPLSDGWFVEPSVGLNYAEIDGGRTPYGGIGSVDAKDVESLLGSLRLRVGTTVQANEWLILHPAVTGGVWHEFKGDVKSSFAPTVGGGAPAFSISTDRVGTFGQIGLALNGEVVGTGASGFVRADYRNGRGVEDYTVSGGLRAQF